MSHRSISYVVEPVTLEIVDLFNSLHPLSGHLKQNNVNTSTPKLPGCKNFPPRFTKALRIPAAQSMKCLKLPAVSLWPASRKPGLDQMIGAPPTFSRDAYSYWSLSYHCLFPWNVKCCNFFKIAAMKHDFKTELEPPFKSPMPFKRRWPSVSFGKMQPHWEQLGNPGSTSGRSIFSSESWSCITWNGRELRERLLKACEFIRLLRYRRLVKEI